MPYAMRRGAPTPAQLHVDRLIEEAGVKAGKENIAQVYLHCMKASPHEIALIDCDSGVEVSNATLLRSIARFARAAAGSGARRTCVVMRNSVPQVTLIYALIAADSMPFMLHYKSTPDEIKYFLDLQEPQLVFCDASTLDIVVAATRIAACNVNVVCCGDAAQANPGIISLDQFGEGFSDDWSDFSAAETAGRQPALLCATSGSTGPPKAVPVAHAAQLAQAYVVWEQVAAQGPQRAMLVSSPQWMTHSMLVLTAPMFGVSVLLTAGDVTGDNMARCISRHKADWMMCSPLIMKAMLAAPAGALSSLRVIVVAGAMPWSDVVETLRRKVPGILVQRAYGITEATGVVALSTLPGVPDQAIGPVSNLFEYKIVDDNGKTITEPLQIGELYIKNDQLIIKSYYNNSEQKVALSDDGWFMTGDRVQEDKDGNIYFVGRKKFSLMYDHYEVIPEEVEGVIGRVAGVAGSFVGLVAGGPAALVVPEPLVDTHALIRQIRETVEASLSRYKHLHGGVYITSHLQSTNTGKLNRSACQDELDIAHRRYGADDRNKQTVF